MPPVTRSGEGQRGHIPCRGSLRPRGCSHSPILEDQEQPVGMSDAVQRRVPRQGQEIFYRYEATGDPTSKDGTSDTRFSWDIEKGNWIPKSEWLEKMIGPTERVRMAAESSEADPIDPVSVEADMETDVPAVEESAKDIASDNINKMESKKSKENVVDDAETEEDIQGEVEDCPSKIIKLKSGPMGVDGKKRKRAHSPPPSPQTQQPEEPDIASVANPIDTPEKIAEKQRIEKY
ncbi:hypothetical protein ACO22_03475 [Paracoccidioides brasiliensis]|uniref:Uncharacterized protein n=1 Tax=Paracoccidioides brasiliensis TaxID=121759 RepID=A0A1D2JFT6_PARBR|nr:hypothetical protein ACO22_03475 [Paracoccidioides brasiliensis]